MSSARIFLHFQDIAPKIRGPYLAMLYVSILWTLLAPVVSQQLARAQFDQYHAVSTQAFIDMVAHNGERHMSHSNTTSECALFCSVLGRPRCFAFALGPGICWVCGPGNGESDPVGAMTEGMVLAAYSGNCDSNML